MTAREIRKLLKARYLYPEWVFLEEVGDGTGVNLHRHLDVVVMNLYPSKGFSVFGIEIKVNRSDLLKELKKGDKSDAVARYCDRFYLAVPRGLLKDTDDIPIMWGVMECFEGGVKLKKQAGVIEQETSMLQRGFVAAMLRALARNSANEIREEFDKGLKEERSRLEKDLKANWEMELSRWREDADRLAVILNKAGIDLRWFDDEKLARYLRLANSMSDYDFKDLERAIHNCEKKLHEALSICKEGLCGNM
jgi:hypothetical protein